MNFGLYYDNDWNRYHEDIDEGKYELFTFQNELGKVIYPMIIREIDAQINGENYYDIVTPKGYSGPTIVHCLKGQEKQLVGDYVESFIEFCEKRNIVSEYVRFNPWIDSYKFFDKYYDMFINGKLFSINLDVDDIMMDEIPSKTRNVIRKAEREGVTLTIDTTGATLPIFLELYDYTVEKNNISERYQFNEKTLKSFYDMLGDKAFIINASIKDEIISSAIFIIVGEQIHYSYSATNPNYYKFNAVSYILHKACLIGKEKCCKMMDLGSGGTESLRAFKRGFSRSGMQFDSVVGKAIRNNDIYNKLVEIKGCSASEYFPKYRG